MAEVLSQSEIDALLSALSAGDVEPEQLKEKEEKHRVKKYDFRSPQKFSKEHIRTLEMVHDSFARIVSNYLSGQLRKHVKMEIQTVEQITYEEFIHSIPNPTVLTIFSMPPLQGNILLEMNPEFSYQILDILLGGEGKRKTKLKDFSEIDKNILSSITSEMINSMKLAWEDIIEVKPQFEVLETNPAASQTLAPNEAVALLSFSVELGKSTTYMNLCIPYLSVEKILDKLIVQYWFKNDNSEVDTDAREKIMAGIEPAKVNLHVELGETEITLNDFLKLVKGDVLVLNTQYNSPVRVFVEDEECFIAKPGIIGKNLGVEILDITDKDVIEIE
ncbi:flagellar motor switch protein FliM [Clostridium isatidis]|uniref:Flagellar motor switch protein FliM n=1 Tax=Clostridium isatidis TaxID=182773 RepID=A0A343JC74_9CLOT|nr:flagellar motor switch protein FliM [Clostridium isatidis]ASW43132.1 flagellar motor switch protein FliM [Clostridium isatidis]NLZ35044.1 flagellar motor switch protein FliM [Clostridiales bacterium]